MRKRREPVSYDIVVLDTITKPFPSAAQLIETGVPLRVARRWAKVRRAMTVGLKRELRERRN